MTICPVCTKQTYPPMGDTSSNILILASQPDKDSLNAKYPFYIDTSRYPKPTFASILRDEFFKLGFDWNSMRKAYLWQHKPNNDEQCFDVGMNDALLEARGKQAILLLGAESVEFFTGYKVSDVSGLRVECNMLSAPIIFAMYNPTIVYKHGVGEIKFALKNFTDAIIKEGMV